MSITLQTDRDKIRKANIPLVERRTALKAIQNPSPEQLAEIEKLTKSINANRKQERRLTNLLKELRRDR